MSKRQPATRYGSLRSLSLENFTLFRKETLTFASGLNVLVGENGTGKTHVLKAAYSGIAGALAQPAYPARKSLIESTITGKFMGVFKPDSLGRLVRRAVGRLRCTLHYQFVGIGLGFQCSFSRLSQNVSLSRSPSPSGIKHPVYLPTRELLSIAPGFVSLYETTHLSFEETWRDTCILLGAPLARGPREAKIKELLAPLEEAMDGKIELDRSGRFYLSSKSSGRMEIHLVAEGLRKIATVARLIATGALLDTGYLFWDEPEANLNPRIIRLAARIILKIAESGIQVFVATHSLFLLRELHILSSQKEFDHVELRCFGFHKKLDGTVSVAQGATIDDIGDITALEEELTQVDRYLAVQYPAEAV